MMKRHSDSFTQLWQSTVAGLGERKVHMGQLDATKVDQMLLASNQEV